MLVSHESNIELVAAQLHTGGPHER
jgi:hypothetical protein